MAQTRTVYFHACRDETTRAFTWGLNPQTLEADFVGEQFRGSTELEESYFENGEPKTDVIYRYLDAFIWDWWDARNNVRGNKVIAADGVSFGEGDRAYNYYDRKPGVLGAFDHPGDPRSWFDFHQDDGKTTQLNGERICSLATAKRRGFKDA